MTLVPRADLGGLAAYVGGVSTLAGVANPIKLSSNEGAFGPPPGAVRALAEAAANLHRYPDGDSRALRAALGRTHGLDPARIVCDTGSDPLFSLLALAYGGPGSELIMSEHGFQIYAIAQTKAGGAVVRAPERDLVTDVDAIVARVTARTRLVMVANPNNPTGTVLAPDELRRLRAQLPPGVLLVVDAAYAEYVDDPAFDAGAALVDGGENTVMTRTFSKAYGLGGVRLGGAYGPPAVIDVLNRLREPFGVGIAAQAAGLAALAEPGWIARVRAHNSRERARLEAALGTLGFGGPASQANFVLAHFGTPERAAGADAHLRTRGIIVRRVASYGLPAHLRITVGTAAEVDAVIGALETFAGG